MTDGTLSLEWKPGGQQAPSWKPIRLEEEPVNFRGGLAGGSEDSSAPFE